MKYEGLGSFLQGIAQLVRENVIAKGLAAHVSKKVLRDLELMPLEVKEAKKEKTPKK
jgi:hypothetical protein